MRKDLLVKLGELRSVGGERGHHGGARPYDVPGGEHQDQQQHHPRDQGRQRTGDTMLLEPPVHRVGGDHQVDGEECGGQYRAELLEQAEGPL